MWKPKDSWLDVVVIALPEGHSGISAKFVGSNQNQSAPLPDRNVQNQIDYWCSLSPPTVPNAEREVLFKISRHRVGDDNFIWFGAYRFARFPRDRRDNTYIGLGILTCNGDIPALPAIDYLGDNIKWLFSNSANEQILWSAEEIAYRLRQDSPKFSAQRNSQQTNVPTPQGKIYFDLQSYVGDLPKKVAEFVHEFQTSREYASTSEVVVGTTPHLRRAIDKYGSYAVNRPAGARTTTDSHVGAGAGDFVLPASVSGRMTDGYANQSHVLERSRADDQILARLSRLEAKVQEIHGRKPPAERHALDDVNGFKFVHFLAGSLLVLSGVTIGIIGINIYNSYYPPNAAGSQKDSVEIGSNYQQTSVVPPCPPADLEADRLDRAAITAELSCSEAEIERLSDRIKLLKDAGK